MISRRTNRVLIVDDEEHILRSISRDLTREGYQCTTMNGGARAKRAIENSDHAFDVILCDLMMPEVDGLDVLRCANAQPEPAPVIILTAYGTVSAAVTAMKLGAVDFLEKPTNPESIRAAIQLATGKTRVNPGFASSTTPAVPPVLVGSDQWLPGFMATLRRIAMADQVTVLIDGETGTGKSAVARQIHAHSPRAAAPFVEVNCASIPAELVESQLFGHLKGTFTGATSDRKGFVAQAQNGTLFLDEVGEFGSGLQSKLLTLLQERRFRPVGAGQDYAADVRFVAATNRNLELDVQHGRFREDLYFRLNVIKLTIPPLRDRVDDIPILVEHFRRRFSRQVGHDVPGFSKAALAAMRRYEWSGNIRELENVVQRLIVMFPEVDEIEVGQLPQSIQDAARIPETVSAPVQVEIETAPTRSAFTGTALPEEGLMKAVENYQRHLLLQALRECHGNKTQAARRLRLKRTTLIEKCNRLEIDAEEFRTEPT